MVHGRILVRTTAFEDAGGGVAIAPRTVLTAAHVVRGRTSEDVHFNLRNNSYAVRAFRYSEDLDAAVLELDREVPSYSRLAHAWPGDQWEIAIPPTLSDPDLSGVIDFAERVFVNSQGHRTVAQQLRVDQDVKDYHAYSGSAIAVPKVGGAVVGILIEQQYVRLLDLGSEVVPATNVLYATPVARIVEIFDLDVRVHRDSLNHSALDIRILQVVHHDHWLSESDISMRLRGDAESIHASVSRLVIIGLLGPGSQSPLGRVKFGTPKDPDRVPVGAFSLTAKGIMILKALRARGLAT
jgi:hypothetical protein